MNYSTTALNVVELKSGLNESRRRRRSGSMFGFLFFYFYFYLSLHNKKNLCIAAAPAFAAGCGGRAQLMIEIKSLEAYVKAERLEGVQCDTLKREVLFKLLNKVFFHLKRFELIFETFRHEKPNQRFEFLEEIELEPYTREGLDRIDKENKEKNND